MYPVFFLMWSKVKQLCMVLGYKLDIKCLENVQWMNPPAKPNTAYIPTTVEHCANVFTHGIWVVPSILCFLNLLSRSHSLSQYWAALVYGCALISVFTVSTFFHSVFFCSQDTQLKEFLHRCDRAMIYVFIAASYFPWVTLRPGPSGTWAGEMDWFIWLMAFLGIVYQQVFHEKYKMLETVFYFIMGVIPASVILSHWTDYRGLFEVQVGGIIYMVGVFFFKSDGRIPFAHAIWHMFVAAAATIHYYAISTYLYSILPKDGISRQT